MIIRNIKNNLYKYKQYCVSLFHYPKLQKHDETYNRYWDERKLTQFGLNSFQKKRAEFVIEHINNNDSLMDIGSGNGGVLAYINETKVLSRMIGVDVSDEALALAEKNGVEAIKANISNENELKNLPQTDYVCLFEVLEHVTNSESLLDWAVRHSKKGVFFSVPNTGFITHRLRLFFGRFPLQWRVHPSEHVRFWTLRDMNWWLDSLGYRQRKVHVYEGIPFLNKIWPGLFGQGLWIYINKTNMQIPI